MAVNPIRIVIADDNDYIRLSLKVFIEVYADFQWVGEAENGREAIQLCQQLQPDLVLMDLIMPQVDGVAATAKITHEFPKIRILVLTSTVEHDLIDQAMKAGAVGYVLKNTTIDALAEAIRSAVV